jgi:hypothetical protein
MKTDSKIAIGISSVFVAFGIFCFVWILPFIFIWSSFGINLSNEESLPYLEKAVKFSVFNAQKRYTIETIIPTLLILEKNKEAIAYINTGYTILTDTAVVPNFITVEELDMAKEVLAGFHN